MRYLNLTAITLSEEYPIKNIQVKGAMIYWDGPKRILHIVHAFIGAN